MHFINPKIFLPLAERSAIALINMSMIKKNPGALGVKKILNLPTSNTHLPAPILHLPTSIFHPPSATPKIFLPLAERSAVALINLSLIKKILAFLALKKTSIFYLPSSILHSPSSIFQHLSPIFHLPSPDIHPSSITPHPTSIINSSTPKI
ncbi:hypothetical protein SAMN05660493_00748, partial [Epilithonimonas bovis DSM 19482]